MLYGQGVNGSGKHNNWSIATDDGTNILNVGQLAKNSGSSEIFPIVMAAIVKVTDRRLGCECADLTLLLNSTGGQ